MSLLSLIQDTANAVGITAPSVVTTSTDGNIVTLLALANESGREMAKAYDWQELRAYSGSIVANGSIDQGTITSVFGASYDRIVNQTFWNLSQRQPIDGPVTPQQFQTDQASGTAGPPYYFFVTGNHIKIGPTALASGQIFSAYFMSKYWCQSSGGTGQTSWTADTDTGIIPEELLKLDLKWRWKQKNGLAYAEDMETAQRQFDVYTAQNTPARVLFLGGPNIAYTTNIPAGFWPG